MILDLENESIREVVVCRVEGKLSTALDGETVILDTVTGIYNGLNPIGTTIWNTLEKPTSIQEIVIKLTSQYDVDEERCLAEVVEFLKSLKIKGLITQYNVTKS